MQTNGVDSIYSNRIVVIPKAEVESYVRLQIDEQYFYKCDYIVLHDNLAEQFLLFGINMIGVNIQNIKGVPHSRRAIVNRASVSAIRLLSLTHSLGDTSGAFLCCGESQSRGMPLHWVVFAEACL